MEVNVIIPEMKIKWVGNKVQKKKNHYKGKRSLRTRGKKVNCLIGRKWENIFGTTIITKETAHLKLWLRWESFVFRQYWKPLVLVTEHDVSSNAMVMIGRIRERKTQCISEAKGIIYFSSRVNKWNYSELQEGTRFKVRLLHRQKIKVLSDTSETINYEEWKVILKYTCLAETPASKLSGSLFMKWNHISGNYLFERMPLLNY